MTIPSAHPKSERRSRRFWVAFICSFFVAQAVLWTFALRAVSNDPSHAVAEDYDRHASSWDDRRDAQRRSDALGWTAELQLADIEGAPQVVLSLRDRTGLPIEGARVEVTAFHRARAAYKQRLALTESTAGDYSSPLRVTRAGRWRFDVTATRGSDTFTLPGVELLAFARGS